MSTPIELFVRVHPNWVRLAAEDMEREGPNFTVTWETTTGELVTLLCEEDDE